MSLARIAIRGAYFTGIALALRQVISLCSTFYIARQLAPADLGLFSMVMIVVGFAQVVGDIGIGTGLVRSQDSSARVVNTCFWISAGLGVVLAGLMVALAPLAGVFYEKPEMVPYLRASAIGLLINFMLPVPMALLQQRLAYREISIAQVLGSFSGAATTIWMVYMGAGTWALVIQPIVGNLVLTAALMTLARWWPALHFDFGSAKEIVRTGMHLLGGSLISYARNNFDALVIGKSLQSRDLGIYSLAHTVLYAPMHLIGSTVVRVLFPLMAKLQNEPDRLREALLVGSARTALLVFPVYFGLIVLADEFVWNVFGPKWIEMAAIIKIIACATLLQTIANVCSPVMLALGKTKVALRLAVGGAVIYVTVLLVLVPYGLIVLSIGYAVTNALLALISIWVCLYYAKVPVLSYVAALRRPLFLACITTGALWMLRQNLDGHRWLDFIGLVVAGTLIYIVLIFKFEKAVWQQMLHAARG